MSARDTVMAGAPRAQRQLDSLAVGMIVACSFIWGLNQVAVKVANQGFQPVLQAGIRSLLAGILIVGWCALRRIPLFERDGTLVPGIVAGILFALEFILIYVALDYTSVSRGIVFVYTMPFTVAIGAHFLLPGERLNLVQAGGLAIAFIGIVVLFSDRLSLPSPRAVFGDVLCILASIGWGATTLVIKGSSLARVSPEKTLVYQLAVSAVVMLGLAPFFGPFLRAPDFWSVTALAYQIVIVVSISYVSWFWLLAHYPAGRLSSFAFLTPVSAVALGWLLLGEPISHLLLVSVALVAAGIYLVNRRDLGRRSPA